MGLPDKVLYLEPFIYRFRHFNHNYLKPLFNKEVPQTKAKKVLEVYHTISVAEALDQIGNEVDVNQKKPLVSTG